MFHTFPNTFITIKNHGKPEGYAILDTGECLEREFLKNVFFLPIAEL